MKSFLGMFRVNGRNYALTFALVSTLFFLWGLCNGMLETMNKHFKDSFHINYMESALVQFAGYTGYFVMAIPAGLLARRFGYKGGILIGLALIMTGALWFIPATKIATFAAFLTGLFIVATGLTMLETIANPVHHRPRPGAHRPDPHQPRAELQRGRRHRGTAHRRPFPALDHGRGQQQQR